MKCIDCKYCDFVERLRCECRFNSPKMVVSKIGNLAIGYHDFKEYHYMTRFPSVATDDWCGKFKEKIKETT